MTFMIVGLLSILVLFFITVMFVIDDNDISQRNYEVRFSAQNNKYYIVNCIHRSEKRVTSRFGFTIYYKDRVEADMICQKLNTVE
ncbi:hypothetical protein GNZ01_06840 [Escherichia coli]|uniref:Uncharacterized protein n=1 Tax=Escherichia coli TaxID=562 RepID=A0AAJ2Y2M5_ECOLX|nr:hypothetical protein [Escherichia coli]MED6572869.1 hypothetical protein [Escherichia coli O157]EFF2106029.1 hypothetical protein [Escherichia coli]EKR8628544.1 hypothetical protein [Escherichia coli]ELQ3159202.1 hypothetical protein [Escherichia coli]MDS1552425.1 hypothetical protein [Escherichia coli]